MRFALVLALSLVACGGTLEHADKGEEAAAPPAPQLTMAPPSCGAESFFVADVPRGASALAASGLRVGYLDRGSVVVVEAGKSAVIASSVAALAASPSMFAFAYENGDLGVYRAALSMRPGSHAFGVAADLADLAWTESTDDRGFVLARTDLDGKPRTIAERVYPVFAMHGERTWYTTLARDLTSVHARGAHEEPREIARDLLGVPSKMVAGTDRAWLSFGDSLIEVGGAEPIAVWQGPFADFAADDHEIAVGLDHAIERLHPGTLGAMKAVSLGRCRVRSVAMNSQIIYALVDDERGSKIVGVGR